MPISNAKARRKASLLSTSRHPAPSRLSVVTEAEMLAEDVAQLSRQEPGWDEPMRVLGAVRRLTLDASAEGVARATLIFGKATVAAAQVVLLAGRQPVVAKAAKAVKADMANAAETHSGLVASILRSLQGKVVEPDATLVPDGGRKRFKLLKAKTRPSGTVRGRGVLTHAKPRSKIKSRTSSSKATSSEGSATRRASGERVL